MADWLREFRNERETKRLKRKLMQPIIYRISDFPPEVIPIKPKIRRSSRIRITRARVSRRLISQRIRYAGALPLSKLIQWLQGGFCYLCGHPMTGKKNTRRCASLDHVRPRRRGGGFRGNMLIACRDCNNGRKGSRPPTACELLYLQFINELLWLA